MVGMDTEGIGGIEDTEGTEDMEAVGKEEMGTGDTVGSRDRVGNMETVDMDKLGTRDMTPHQDILVLLCYIQNLKS